MRLPPQPELTWDEHDTPRAAAFDDVYFSRAGGLEESEAVFLRGCGLPEAWSGRDRYAICEVGFGTGLNILATIRAWRRTRIPHAHLHISTVEAFPLARHDAVRALAPFEEVRDLTNVLLSQWPVRAYGPQCITFPDDDATLWVHIGDAETILSGLSGAYDAWFLDGFAPARNPDIWSEALIAHVARLSAPGARAATFTVSGQVRRSLAAAGFEVARFPGFGTKRERLEARLPHRLTPTPQGRRGTSIYPYAAAQPKRVAIIGAGIAGAACAHASARRGVETLVLDAAADIASGASGNPAALVMPRLDRGGVLQEFFLASYLHAVATYDALGESVFNACGVEQRARDGDALADLLVDPPLPEDWLSALPNGAALHARAGVVRPRETVLAMLSGADVRTGAKVERIERVGDRWVLRSSEGIIAEADTVVIANGPGLAGFHQTSFLPIELSYGQIEWGRAGATHRAISQSAYIAPLDDGVIFGATFDREPAPQAEARARNIAALTALAPDIAGSIDPDTLHSRASIRAATPDRAPIAGLLPDAPAWLAQYASLAHGSDLDPSQAPPAHRGVYVIGGLGARGFTFAPLLGERIAAEICREPPFLQQPMLDALHPARFLHRALKRGLTDRLG